MGGVNETETGGDTRELILLVEDEAFVRKAAAEALESAGYSLIVASDAAEALKVYCGSSKPVDLLLADVVLPGMNGRDLAADFEIRCPQARVLLMSGYSEQLASCEESAWGRNYIAKPFPVSTLLRRVREVLDTIPQESGALAYPTFVSR